MRRATLEHWTCPFCTHTVPYGKTCPDDPSTCTRGEKNIVWNLRVKFPRGTTREGQSIGIAEIAKEEAE